MADKHKDEILVWAMDEYREAQNFRKAAERRRVTDSPLYQKRIKQVEHLQKVLAEARQAVEALFPKPKEKDEERWDKERNFYHQVQGLLLFHKDADLKKLIQELLRGV